MLIISPSLFIMRFVKILSVFLILTGIALTLSINVFAVELTNSISKYKISGFPYGVDVNSLYTAVDPESQWSGVIDSPMKTVGIFPFVTQNGETVALGIDTACGWIANSQRVGKDLVVEYTFKGAWIKLPDDPNFGSWNPKDIRLLFYCANLPVSNLTIYVDNVSRPLATGTLVPHTYGQSKKLDPSSAGWPLDSDPSTGLIVFKGYSPNGDYFESDSTNTSFSYYGFTFWLEWTSKYQVFTVKFKWTDVFPDQIGSFQIPNQTTKAIDLTTSMLQGLYTLVYPLLTCTGFMLFGLAIKKIYSHG